MKKLFSVLAATIVIVAGAASAEAGFAVKLTAPAHFSQIEKAGCGGGHARIFRRRVAYQSARRPKRHVEVASRRVSKPVTVAKVEPKPVVKDDTLASVTGIENSTIAPAADQVATPEIIVPENKPAQAAAVAKENPEQKVATAVKDVGCKSFFASVGMTLSVPCAK